MEATSEGDKKETQTPMEHVELPSDDQQQSQSTREAAADATDPAGSYPPSTTKVTKVLNAVSCAFI